MAGQRTEVRTAPVEVVSIINDTRERDPIWTVEIGIVMTKARDCKCVTGV